MNIVKLFQVSLNRAETTHLPDLSGQKLFFRCAEGAAWLTAARDPQDYILDEGHEIHMTGTPRDVLIESLSDHLEIEVYVCN